MRLKILSLLLVIVPMLAHAEPAGALSADSLKKSPDKEISASVLLVSPGNKAYSAAGHLAIRMQYPAAVLDYCFTFEMDLQDRPLRRFFFADANAGFAAAPTEMFLSQYQKERRTVMSYPLDMTHKEKQNLWRNLDNEIKKGPYRKFDIFKDNCTSSCVDIIMASLEADDISEKDLSEEKNGFTRRDQLKSSLRQSPIYQMFWNFTLGGVEADEKADSRCDTPLDAVTALMQTTVVDSIGSRTLLSRHASLLAGEMNPVSFEPSDLKNTMLLLIGLMLIIFAATLTAANMRNALTQAGVVFDAFLIIVETILGLWLTLMIFSNHSATGWNPYLLVFNLIPLTVWLLFRRNKHYGTIFGVFCIVAVIFVVATPFIPCAQWPLQMLVITMAIRCLNRYFITNFEKKRRV